MKDNFLVQISKSLDAIGTQHLYFSLLSRAKESNFHFNVRLGANKSVFDAEKVNVKEGKVIFEGKSGFFQIAYSQIIEIEPDFNAERIEIVASKPAKLNYLLALIAPLIFPILFWALVTPMSQNNVLTEFIVPTGSVYEVASVINKYDDETPYYNGPSADEIITPVKSLVTNSFLNGFGAAFLVTSSLVCVFSLRVLTSYNSERMVDISEGHLLPANSKTGPVHLKASLDEYYKWYELVISLIKALVWPGFALIILVTFWQPLFKAMNQLPDIVGNSEVITIANLSFKINRGLQSEGLVPSYQVKQVLSEMTPDDIKNLMSLTGGIYYDVDQAIRGKAENAELVKLGLATEIPYNELQDTNSGKNYGYGIEITDFGNETKDFIYAVINQFLRQLSIENGTPTPQSP